MRCLGVAMEQRHPQLPNCPTFKEQGFDLVGGAYRGVAVPKSTPANIQMKLASDLAKVNADPEFIRKMEAGGFAMLNVGPKEMPQFMKKYQYTQYDDQCKYINTHFVSLNSQSGRTG